jgi:hypothetical protein
MEHVHSIGGFLVQLYDTNPHKAGDWGFEIDDSPREEVIRKGTINPGQMKVIRNLAVGSIMTNKGTVSLKIHKGETAGSTPVTLDPNQKFVIARGFGMMTMQNESPDMEGTYEAEFHK